ncbi:uncharacterized protein LOC116131384 [Pistacia vera]|uniref:uncharacterized protein LOC116131384 n=1 Tax=Pistacia vera TaxID=55513 RepID=UPI001263ADBE|nr:uncharacterized protein LOC116131384 [Pistacia vera]
MEYIGSSFSVFSKARTLHLRNLLQTTKKESLSVNEYVLKMKELGDELVDSGVNLSDEELLLYILDGLRPEYDVVVPSLTYNSKDATLQEAELMFHKHEIRLARQSSALTYFHKQFTSTLIASKQGLVIFSPYVQSNTSGTVFPNTTHVANTRSLNYQTHEVYS